MILISTSEDDENKHLLNGGYIEMMCVLWAISKNWIADIGQPEGLDLRFSSAC